MPAASGLITQIRSASIQQWEENSRLPRAVGALFAALRFSAPAPDLLRQLSDAQWNSALYFADRSSLTLFLGVTCREYLPDWVRERIHRNLAGNTERVGRMRAMLVEVAEQLDEQHVEYLLLKGFAQEMDYSPDPYARVGYDIDLYAPPGSLSRAYDILRSMAYVPMVDGAGKAAADHFPPLIRKNGWQFRGDLFDPEIPGSIDLHFRFWDPETERFPAPGAEDFWTRRIRQDGLPVMGYEDRLGYTALHLLRHLLRADIRPSHVYELAYFLDTQSGNEPFWDSWLAMHPAPLRRLEAISFLLAASWFGCRTSAVVREEIDRLDGDIPLWFERYAASPIEAQFHPNKHELWLHFALVDKPADRRRVLARRIFPASLPARTDGVFIPDEQMNWRFHLRYGIKYLVHVGERFMHHARALPPVVAHGLLWKSRTWLLPVPFWRLLGCSLLFFLGMYQFALLYNLYLLDLGYRENVLGLVASAFTAGCLAGVVPTAALARRFGLKRTLLTGVAGSAVAFALRASVTGEPALLATAFAAGALYSLWTVSLSPAIAAVTPETARPTAFSFTIGSGIALGMVATLVGGRLPAWVARTGLASSAAQTKQLVLLAGTAATALALWPLIRIRIESPPSSESRRYPRGAFIRRFLLATAAWSFATGAFNPLFNAYFARRFAMAADSIGIVFSIAQAAQVVAILAAPVVLRRLGLTRGVAAMQLATALMLALLAPASVALAAGALYAAYLSFQYMSEPGIYSALMNQVPPSQHSGASALNFLIVFGSQAVAASAAGAVVTRYGYPPMLAAAAALAVVAAWMFSRLEYDGRSLP